MKNKILSVVLAVLCVLSMIPFSAFADENVTVKYGQFYGSHNFTDFAKVEAPYAADGNYTLYGLQFNKGVEFDGETVTEISRNAEYEDMYAYRDKEPNYKTDYQVNMFSYNQFNVAGKPVRLVDSNYVIVEYYYDTSAREEISDDNYTEITGNKMVFGTNSLYLNGSKNSSYNVSGIESNEAIVANEWATCVIPVGAAFTAQKPDVAPYFNDADYLDKGQMGQFKLHPFGSAEAINLHLADKFYIKSITFSSYDYTTQNLGEATVSVSLDTEVMDPLYEDYHAVLESVTLPEFDEDYVPAGAEFLYYVEANTGIKADAGESVVLNWGTSAGPLLTYEFYPTFSGLEKITFTVDGEENFTEYYAFGTDITLPDAAEAPEGYVFAGWSDGTNTYKAGGSYLFDNKEVAFTAVFVIPGTYYVSADGAIEGITETVYTSLAEADAAIAANGNIGTVLVEGDLPVQGTINFASSEITIEGYDNTGKLWINGTTTTTVGGYIDWLSADGTTIVIDDIAVRRADTYTDEAWFRLSGIDLTFGSGITYEAGKRAKSNTDMTLTSTVLNIYVSQYTATGKGFSLTNESPIQFAMVTSIGQWDANGGTTFAGDFHHVFKNGYAGSYHVTSRNGNGNGAKYKIDGDVSFEMNGGHIKTVALGNYQTDITGDVSVLINGGKIDTLYFGDQNRNSKNETSVISGTYTFVVNAAEMDAAPAVTRGTPVDAATSILVYNNTELADEAVASNVSADYLVLVNSGVATPVEGENGKFEIVPDDNSFDQVLANGVVLEADSDGYYTLTEGKTLVSFGKEGFESYDFSYTVDGSEPTLVGSYYNGTEFALPALTPATGFAFDGYVIGGVTYAAGDKFVMPEEDVVAEAVFFENTTNTWYVSNAGKDSNGGHKAGAPVATIAKAFELIAGKDGTIVLMDMVSGFSSAPLADGQTVTITGEGYEGAGFANGKTRLGISKGHLILEHLIDYNDGGNETNTPFILSGNAQITIGTGYKLATKSGDKMNVTNNGTQIEMPNANNPVVNVDGDVQFINFIDWGNGKITGDVVINVGPNAHFGSTHKSSDGGLMGISFGGDSGGSGQKATVEGKIYVNVDGTQSTHKIYRNGFKSTTSNELNGFQILLKDTTMTYGGDFSAKGEYKNNGAEYIVTANTIEGADVVTTSFGKVKVTLSADQKAVITDANGTRAITATEEITLAEGETLIECATNAEVSVIVGDADPVVKTAGTLFTLPEGVAPEGELFIGWTVEGEDEVYLANSQYKLPATNGAVVTFVPYTIPADTHVYLDTANGNDANSGFAADKAVQTVAKAQEILAVFPETATLHIVGTLAGENIALPLYNGVLTVVGTGTNGIIQGNTGMVFKSDVVLKDIGLKMLQNWKHIVLDGHDLTVGEGAYKVEGSQPLTIHAGVQNANQTGDQSIKVLGGYIDTLQIGPYYINKDQVKTWTGDMEVTVDNNGYIGGITYGDGYDPQRGTFIHDGSVVINIGETGEVGSINTVGYNANDTEGQLGTTGGYVVYNYSATVPSFNMWATDYADSNSYLFNFTGDVTGTFADGVLTVNKDAYIVETGSNSVENLISDVSAGYNTIRAGKSLMNEGLDVEGAQIRIATSDVDQGLRFVANFTDELAAQYEGCEYGFVVIPTVVIGNNAVEAEGEYTYNDIPYAPAIVAAEILYADKGDYVQYTACMTGLTADMYKTEYTAVPYILTEDGYIYGEQYSTSVYKIAQAVLADESVTDESVKAAMQELIAAADAQ